MLFLLNCWIISLLLLSVRPFPMKMPLDVMPELEQQEDEHAREIAAAVLSLPGKYREVMVLYYEQGMRIREIAEALHMPLNSVSSRLRRAKALLRNEVEGGNDA